MIIIKYYRNAWPKPTEVATWLFGCSQTIAGDGLQSWTRCLDEKWKMVKGKVEFGVRVFPTLVPGSSSVQWMLFILSEDTPLFPLCAFSEQIPYIKIGFPAFANWSRVCPAAPNCNGQCSVHLYAMNMRFISIRSKHFLPLNHLPTDQSG